MPTVSKKMLYLLNKLKVSINVEYKKGPWGGGNLFISNLQKYLQDKTLILITHKGSMLNMVDRLIMLDKGQIIADGPRDVVIKDLAEGKISEAMPKRKDQE